MYLLDTVVLSELRKRRRNPGVAGWFERQRAADLFISVISIGEIERGIARQRTTNPSFAAALAHWLDRTLVLYSEQILPFGLKAARRWGTVSAAVGHQNADVMIAATALEHGLTVVTRNTSHFGPTGVRVLNPFAPHRRPN
jgi:toxin FitB